MTSRKFGLALLAGLLLAGVPVAHANSEYLLRLKVPGGFKVDNSSTPGEPGNPGGGEPSKPEETPGPAKLVFETSFDFGRVPYLKQTSKSFYLKAEGGTEPAIFNPSPDVRGLMIPNQFSLKGTDCTGSLAPGASCAFELTINATSTMPMSGRITLISGKDSQETQISLAGTPFKEVEVIAGVVIPASRSIDLAHDLKQYVRLNIDNVDMSKLVVSIQGAAPEGLALDSASSQLTGRPLKGGEQTFTLKADYQGQSSTGLLTLKVETEELRGIKDIALGDTHACALMHQGSVRCWGSNSSGQLGDPGLSSSAKELIPRLVPGVNDAVQIVAADQYTCVLTNSGSVRCWGVLPPMNSAPMKTPSVVAGFEAGIDKIATGFGALCALQGGIVKCRTNVWEPLAVSPAFPSPVTDFWISGRSSVACVRGTSTGIACWGADSRYLADNSDTMGAGLETDLFFKGDVLAVGSSYSPCALLATGQIQCAKGPDPRLVEFPPELASGVTDMSAGLNAFCALKAGTVICWGGASTAAETGYRLGMNTPMPVPGLPSPVAKVSVGVLNSCAVMPEGTAYCWGTGIRGDGSPSNLNTFSVVQVQN